MTLVLNEIHLVDGLNRTVLIAAADRRITKVNGSHFGTHPKLFHIPYLNGAISYFGRADFRDVTDGTQNFWDWLPAFIRRQSAARDLKTFTYKLCDALHRLIPGAVIGEQPSGFHICGYNERSLPDFWFLTNIRKMKDYAASEFKPSYKTPSSHFLERDAKGLGWDGHDPSSARSNRVMIYRNGDFRAHAVVSRLVDEIFKHMSRFRDFKRPKNPSDYGDYVLFKFRFIAALYRKWMKHERIGEPIDIMVWSADARRGRVDLVKA